MLYGPPASGKDTITRALTELDKRYQLFPRMKHGPGRMAGYRMVTTDQLQAIRATPGEILWENDRYGATYLVDQGHLAAMLSRDLVPVLHVGQVEAVHAITAALPDVQILIVALTCPRSMALTRIQARSTGDTPERLAAYDHTEELTNADLTMDTSVVTPAQAAQRIIDLDQSGYAVVQ